MTPYFQPLHQLSWIQLRAILFFNDFFKLRKGASSTRFVGRSVCRSVCRSVRQKKCQKKFYSLKMTFLSKSQKTKVTQDHDWTLNQQQTTQPPPNHPPNHHPPTHPPLDKYVEDRIQFRPENKSFLTQCVNLKNILKLNPNINWTHHSLI